MEIILINGMNSVYDFYFNNYYVTAYYLANPSSHLCDPNNIFKQIKITENDDTMANSSFHLCDPNHIFKPKLRKMNYMELEKKNDRRFL